MTVDAKAIVEGGVSGNVAAAAHVVAADCATGNFAAAHIATARVAAAPASSGVAAKFVAPSGVLGNAVATDVAAMEGVVAEGDVTANVVAVKIVAASAVTGNAAASAAHPQPHAHPQPNRKPGIKPRDAFNICHEVYLSARELVDSRLPTSQLAGSSKFIWRPDLRPRLVEYVADFALCGERALGPRSALAGTAHVPGKNGTGSESGGGGGSLRQDVARAQSIGRASRMVLFHVYFLGGAEYQAARRLLGISEINFADWSEEIRDRVGRELLRRRVFPPSRYFKVPSSMR